MQRTLRIGISALVTGMLLAGGSTAQKAQLTEVDLAARSDAGEPTAEEPLMATVPCAKSVQDKSNPGACLSADSTPTLGRLFPLSADFFIQAATGNVGVGTTTPAATLDVDGSARVSDTLTLAPAGDQALDVSTGSVYKAGALFLHTKGGIRNMAVGMEAMTNVTTGFSNTAVGERALYSNLDGDRNIALGDFALYENESGFSNTAIGGRALRSNTTGFTNTAVGQRALYYNSTGSSNTASGYEALFKNEVAIHNTATGFRAMQYSAGGSYNTATGSQALHNNTSFWNVATGMRALAANTTGFRNTATGHESMANNVGGLRNTASGSESLYNNTSGSYNMAAGHRALYYNSSGARNIAIGAYAGLNLTTGSDNIAIGSPALSGESGTIRVGATGTHTTAFMAGIRGVTTGVADAIPVLVDSAGQLGTMSSSRRFKEEIRDMGDTTSRLLDLRPVVFRFKPEVQGGERPQEYGLIAEEVAAVFPELVVYDEEGRPFTVKYHVLSSMLLNELGRLNQRLEEEGLSGARELEELRARITALEDSPR